MAAIAAPANDDFAGQRAAMVADQIAARGIDDARVLAAMGAVPRHRFVPHRYLEAAYADHPLPIGFGQTISQPYIVAYMCAVADIRPADRVLEVGTGSAYHAAVMAQLAKEVFTIEIVPELAARAQKTIADLAIANIHLRQGDGYFGWAEAAPFDVIVVTAAAEHIPPPLIRQLADGGRMVIPLGHPFFVQKLVLVEKRHGRISSRDLIPVRFVPLSGSH